MPFYTCGKIQLGHIFKRTFQDPKYIGGGGVFVPNIHIYINQNRKLICIFKRSSQELDRLDQQNKNSDIFAIYIKYLNISDVNTSRKIIFMRRIIDLFVMCAFKAHRFTQYQAHRESASTLLANALGPRPSSIYLPNIMRRIMIRVKSRATSFSSRNAFMRFFCNMTIFFTRLVTMNVSSKNIR